MRYRAVAEAYRDLEATTGRREITARLAALFLETPPRTLPTVVYLSQGKIAPDFAGVEMGMAEKLAARAVGEAAGVAPGVVGSHMVEAGDLGLAAERLVSRRRRSREALQAEVAFDRLHEVARAAGPGSRGRKLELLVGLLRAATPLEARYLVRTVTRRLRLGVGDAAILDALASAFAEPAARPILERGYNVTSDLGLVAAALVDRGIDALAALEVRPGNPVRPMLAQRLGTPADVLAKLGGRCAAEYKYDGLRVQAHRLGDEIQLYSRRLQRFDAQFPDAVALVERGLRHERAIMEAELVAYVPESGELRPFQDLGERRRKLRVEEAVAERPVSLFCFDILYADGEDLTPIPYPERRARLDGAIERSARLRLTTATTVDTEEHLSRFFDQAVAEGCEGLVCKSVAPGSSYRAGARAWGWVKLKRDYRTELRETFDLAVVGAFHGRGRRAGVYGALLLAARDEEKDVFRTFCKCGTGFSDADLAKLPEMLGAYRTADRPARVEARIEPDAWFEPAVILEVFGAEITVSPNHTAARGRPRPDAGLALRFPRFTGRYREDKGPEDATTVDEIWDMFLSATRSPG